MKNRQLWLVGILLLLCSCCGIKTYVKTTTVRTTTDGFASVQSRELEKAWKSSYQHVFVLQTKDSLQPFAKLEELLDDKAVYTAKNTFIICTESNLDYVKEICGNIKVFALNSLLSMDEKQGLSEGTMSRIKGDEGYEFRFVREKAY